MENRKFAFSAISQQEENNLPSPKESEVKGKDFVAWGEANHYCDFLYDLYTQSPSVQTIIGGTTDFVVGNDVSTTVHTEREIEDIVALCATDYQIFGGYALVIYRNKLGEIKSCDWLDIRKIRTNEKNSVFYYSEDWNKSYGRVKTLVYPAFMPESKELVSVLYVKNKQSRSAYPTPSWNSAVKDAKIETEISSFHLNEICNNFSASAVINFNNGTPSDEQKEEIEDLIDSKFTGSGNAGRFLIAFNENKDNATTIERLDADGFADRYTNLEKTTRQRIFTAFRATPALFGLMNESTGFSSQEFAEAFQLYNRTKVRAIQKIFKNNFERVFGEGTLTFVPFTIEQED